MSTKQNDESRSGPKRKSESFRVYELMKDILKQNEKIINLSSKLCKNKKRKLTEETDSNSNLEKDCLVKIPNSSEHIENVETRTKDADVETNISTTSRRSTRKAAINSEKAFSKQLNFNTRTEKLESIRKSDCARLVFRGSSVNGELIEEGKCNFPYGTLFQKKGIKFITSNEINESRNILNWIVRRYRNFECPNGGSAYNIRLRMNETINKNGLHSCGIYCYGREKFKCNFQLRFVYNVHENTYKLFRFGTHSHTLNNKSVCSRSDLVLDKMSQPQIEICRSMIK